MLIRLTLLLIICLSLPGLHLPVVLADNPVNVVETIIIDPGHGGSDDPGAVGPTGLLEKELTLNIAKKLQQLILADPEMSGSGVKVILTRDSDTRVGLEERAAIANGAGGDIFISIHANGHQARSAKGAETFFLSLKASNEHAQNVAMIENQGFEEEQENAQAIEDDELKLVLFDFIHKQYIAESKFLAEYIQNEFNLSINNGDRGVHQAPFRVLKGVAMPAVLVEVDFITNPDREQLLRSDAYQIRFATSLMKAIKEYKRLKERGLSSGVTN